MTENERWIEVPAYALPRAFPEAWRNDGLTIVALTRSRGELRGWRMVLPGGCGPLIFQLRDHDRIRIIALLEEDYPKLRAAFGLS